MESGHEWNVLETISHNSVELQSSHWSKPCRHDHFEKLYILPCILRTALRGLLIHSTVIEVQKFKSISVLVSFANNSFLEAAISDFLTQS